MSTAETPKQQSVEELLVSIRQAIHGENASAVSTVAAPRFEPGKAISAKPAPATGSMTQTRVKLEQTRPQRNGATTDHSSTFNELRDQLHDLGAHAPHQDRPSRPATPSPAIRPVSSFAGILNGDTRLEEALEKLKRAGLGNQASEATSELRVSEADLYEPDPYEPDYDEAEYVEPDYGEADYERGDEHHTNYTGQDSPEVQHHEEPQTYADDYAAQDAFSPETRQAYIDAPETDYRDPAYMEQGEPQTAVAAHVPEHQPEIPANEAPLTSDQSAAAASAAFNRLADTIVGHATTGERSIDDITRELLRPMLQSWLDENLPRLVERLVREEIERVSRWGGK